MHPVKTFHVRPALSERLKALEELAWTSAIHQTGLIAWASSSGAEAPDPHA